MTWPVPSWMTIESSNPARPARLAADASIDQLHEKIFELHPSVLSHIGLQPALRAIAERQVRELGPGTEVSVAPAATGVHEALLFSVGREVLTNAARHANATHVVMDIRRLNGSIVLEARDDGCGFNPARLERRAGGGAHRPRFVRRARGGTRWVIRHPQRGRGGDRDSRLTVGLGRPDRPRALFSPRIRRSVAGSVAARWFPATSVHFAGKLAAARAGSPS